MSLKSRNDVGFTPWEGVNPLRGDVGDGDIDSARNIRGCNLAAPLCHALQIREGILGDHEMDLQSLVAIFGRALGQTRVTNTGIEKRNLPVSPGVEGVNPVHSEESIAQFCRVCLVKTMRCMRHMVMNADEAVRSRA